MARIAGFVCLVASAAAQSDYRDVADGEVVAGYTAYAVDGIAGYTTWEVYATIRCVREGGKGAHWQLARRSCFSKGCAEWLGVGAGSQWLLAEHLHIRGRRTPPSHNVPSRIPGTMITACSSAWLRGHQRVTVAMGGTTVRRWWATETMIWSLAGRRAVRSQHGRQQPCVLGVQRGGPVRQLGHRYGRPPVFKISGMCYHVWV